MYKPNIVPHKPRFHRIDSQEYELEDENYRAKLKILKEGSEEIRTVEFLIPITSCVDSFTVFEVCLDPADGWTLLYQKTVTKTVVETKTVMAFIPHVK